MIDNEDRNSDVIPGGSMSVTKADGTTPYNEGFEGSVGLMALLPSSDEAIVGGTNGALGGASMADLHQGFMSLTGNVQPDNTLTFAGPDDSGEVDQRKPWDDPNKGFLTRPMGGER